MFVFREGHLCVLYKNEVWKDVEEKRKLMQYNARKNKWIKLKFEKT